MKPLKHASAKSNSKGKKTLSFKVSANVHRALLQGRVDFGIPICKLLIEGAIEKLGRLRDERKNKGAAA